MDAIIRVLDRVEETAQSVPPVDNKASRFGNPAFKTFYDKVTEVCMFTCSDRRVLILAIDFSGSAHDPTESPVRSNTRALRVLL